jgi:hypothetical protein
MKNYRRKKEKRKRNDKFFHCKTSKTFKALQLPWMLLDLWKCSQRHQGKCDLNLLFIWKLSSCPFSLLGNLSSTWPWKWSQVDERKLPKTHHFLGDFMKWTLWNLFIRGKRSFEEEDGYWKNKLKLKPPT